ncbi:MAG: UDP-3-O-(3-hydroxymyristoyl)glucosamine N-acyltransferase [Chitinophagales bacterium]
MQLSIAEVAAKLKGKIKGDDKKMISQPAKIEDAGPEDISFIANPKYEKYAAQTKAGALIVGKDFNSAVSEKTSLILVDDPYQGFAFVLREFSKAADNKSGIESPVFIHSSAKHEKVQYIGAFSYIGENVKIGKGVKIFPQCYIGDNVEIGDNTTVYAGVKLYAFAKVGNNCILHSGAVIGSDGFGFAPNEKGGFEKIPQLGNVEILDNVEIGANTTIDRATLGSTTIGKGVKLDNLVQVAHNVVIGENSAIAAQAGISGSTKIGKRCLVGGQVGFTGHIEIADDTKINAQSGVARNIKEGGKAWNGSPAIEYSKSMKALAALKSLPEMQRKLIALERELEKIKGLEQ